MTTLAQQLGEIVTGLAFDRLSPAAVDTVKRGFTDLVGVLLAGREEMVVDVARRFTSRTAPAWSEAVALSDGRRTEVSTAAFLDAVAGHALDFDDMALDGHPSVVLAPVAFAMAQREERSGSDAIAAYATGYAVWAALLDMLDEPIHTKGWHPTATIGTIAAAAVAARLRDLDAETSARAMAAAASMAAGIVANFGTMMKPLQAGFAARNGIFAAELAACGATASLDALESRHGLIAALSPSGHIKPSRLERIELEIVQRGLNVKLYPVCYAMHRIIDATLQLRADYSIRPDDVEEVEAALGSGQLSMLREGLPSTVAEARFSTGFAVACALLKGRVGLPEMNNAFVRSAAARQLMSRVRIRALVERDERQPLFSPFDQVTVRLRNGAVLKSEKVIAARGSMQRPVGWDGLWDKFAQCAKAGTPQLDARPFFDWLRRLDEHKSIQGFCASFGAKVPLAV
ncbi:MAG TPA: MmgE/PrpD family protein [Bradyrhizobium sp.]|nr:MmgE/PrpD family protein [Bradyrhizobium sp.]